MAFKSQLELFVERYVKNVSSFGNIRNKKKIILKALYMIDAELGIPCCDNPTAIVSYTREDDILTNFLRNYFAENFDRRKNINSLSRIKAMLINALGRYATEYQFITLDDQGRVPSCCFIQFRFNVFQSDDILESTKLSFILTDADNGTVVVGPTLFVPTTIYNIPKGNYRLTIIRTGLYGAAFNTMGAAISTELNNDLLGGLFYPLTFDNVLGEYISSVISIQEDSYIDYVAAVDPG